MRLLLPPLGQDNLIVLDLTPTPQMLAVLLVKEDGLKDVLRQRRFGRFIGVGLAGFADGAGGRGCGGGGWLVGKEGGLGRWKEGGLGDASAGRPVLTHSLELSLVNGPVDGDRVNEY